MTPPNPLTELAARVQALTSACRETDALIAIALGIVPEGAFRPCAAEDVGTFATGSHSFWTAPAFTASLDAAMTLAVEKWWLTLDRFLMSDDPTRSSLYAKTWRVWLKRFVGDLEGDAHCYQQKILATGPTPAIALTAGWLRARDASEKTPHGR